MIGTVRRRGTNTRRLLGHLLTEGLPGERRLESAHVDARVIAGYESADTLQPPRRSHDRSKYRADVSALAALPDAPVRAGGVGKDVEATYHLAISAVPTDRTLTDAEWADVAELYVGRLGLAKRGDDDAVRWVAVRHADNHVHVVATLVRQVGLRGRVSEDGPRVAKPDCSQGDTGSGLADSASSAAHAGPSAVPVRWPTTAVQHRSRQSQTARTPSLTSACAP